MSIWWTLVVVAIIGVLIATYWSTIKGWWDKLTNEVSTAENEMRTYHQKVVDEVKDAETSPVKNATDPDPYPGVTPPIM